MRTLDVDRFRELPAEQQTEVLTWLKEHGLSSHSVFSITLLTEGTVAIGRYLQNEAGQHYYDSERDDAAQETVVISANRPPPEPAFR